MFVDKLLKMLCAKLNVNVMLIITTSKNHLLVLFNAYQYCSMQGYFSLIRFKFKLVLLFPMSDEVYFINLQFYVDVLQIVVCPFVLFLLAIVLSVLLRCTYSDYLFGIFKLLFQKRVVCTKFDIYVFITKSTILYDVFSW